MEKHEIVIVGAGPGGLRAAELLAKEGRDVLIVEKMKDREVGNKVCAGAISPKTLNFFPKDMFETFTHKLSFFTPSLDKVMLESEKPFMGMISRHELGQWQLDRAMSAGAALMDDTEANGVSIKEKKLKTTKGEIGYDTLIGAEGTTSVIRKSLGLKRKEFLCFQWTLPNTKHEELEVYLNFTRFGFGAMYLFPHGDYIVCGGGGADPRKPIKDFRDYTKKFFEKRFDFSNAVYGAAGVSFDYKGFRFGNIFLTGDAAGMPSTIFEDGIYQAAKSGEIAAKAISRKEYNWEKELNKTLLKHYDWGPVAWLPKVNGIINLGLKVVDKVTKKMDINISVPRFIIFMAQDIVQNW